MAQPTNITRFKGLNNVSDPMRLGLGWLSLADNTDITDTGAMVRRTGYSRALAASISHGNAYGMVDDARAYVVDAGTLKAVTGTAAVPGLSTLATGLASTPMHWTEINEQVFYNNGVDSGIITADHQVLPWAWSVPAAPALTAVTGSLPAGLYQVRCTHTLADGRMTGPSESAQIELTEGQALQISSIPQLAGGRTNVYIAPANSTVYGLAEPRAGAAMVWNASPNALGIELAQPFCDPLPTDCSVVQAWRGRIYAAQYFPSLDQSAIWFSQPLGFHLFDLGSSFILVPGKALMLAPHDLALVIGTDKAISAYDGEILKQLAPYGVVPGRHWSEDDDKRLIFWTQRGVCAALPFSNLTQTQVSVAPGVQAGGAIVRRAGQKRYLVALQQGGSAFNQR